MRIDFPDDRMARAEALDCLFAADPSPQERASEAIELWDTGQIDLSGLVGIWIGERAVAAGLLCCLPDGTAFAWPPGVRHDASQPRELAVEVLRALIGHATSRKTRFIQALVDPDRKAQAEAFAAAGFRWIARLRTLQRPLDRPLKPSAEQRRTLVPFEPANEQRFSRVVERSYQDSLDCPSFGGLRDASEALSSYRFAGDFTPERWGLLEDGGNDVAVIIVNDHRAERSREIVYLGVVPEARRNGHALRLVEDVIAEAMSDGCESVVTAVDAGNNSAIDLYSKLGFVPSSDRDVFIWQPKSSQNATIE